MDLLLEHAQIITMNAAREVLTDGAIAIDGNEIADIGPSDELRRKYPQAKQVVNCNGKAIFPGLINTHIHSFQNMLKGLGKDKALFEWLNEMIGPCMIHMKAEDLAYGAKIAALEGIRSGTTTMMDYQYANIVPFAADAVIDAFSECGMRLLYARGYADTGAEQGWATPEEMEDIDTILNESRRLHEKYALKNQGMIEIWMAPSAIWLCTEECLAKTGALCKELGLGMTSHMSETPWDTEASMILHKMSELDICEKLGLLNEKFVMVHCVTFTEKECEVAKKTGATVSYNPVSNMYLASGVAPITMLYKEGVTLSIATDGAASNNNNDMLECLKTSVLLQKVTSCDPTALSADDVLAMATIHAAKAIGHEHDLGSLEIGKKADLFVFNPLLSPKSVPMHDAVATLVYSSSPASVESVLVNGKWVLKDNVVQTVPEADVLKAATQAATALVKDANIKL